MAVVEETEARGEEQEAGGGGGGGRRRREAAVGARAAGRRAGLGTRMEKQRAGEEEAGGSHIFLACLPLCKPPNGFSPASRRKPFCRVPFGTASSKAAREAAR